MAMMMMMMNYDDELWVNFTAEEWRDYQAYHRRRQRQSGYGHSYSILITIVETKIQMSVYF